MAIPLMNHGPSLSGHEWGRAIRTFPETLQTPGYKRMFQIDTPCCTAERNLGFGELDVYLLLERYSLTDLGGFKRMSVSASAGKGGGEKVCCGSTSPSIPGDHVLYPGFIVPSILCQVPASSHERPRRARNCSRRVKNSKTSQRYNEVFRAGSLL